MNGQEKSDPAIVAGKSTNEAERSGSEPMEPRAGTEGKAVQQSAFRTQGRVDASQALERLRQAARRNKKERFTALMRHVTIERLETAFRGIAKSAAAGVDGVTWRDYEADRGRKLANLHARVLKRSVSGDAEPAGLYTQAGRRQTPAGGGGAGGQDRPARRGRGAERRLRGRLPRLQLRLSSRAGRA